MESNFVKLNLEKFLAEHPVESVDKISLSIQQSINNFVNVGYKVNFKEPVNIRGYQVIGIKSSTTMSLKDDESSELGYERANEFLKLIKETYGKDVVRTHYFKKQK